jgi:hypothetical protein
MIKSAGIQSLCILFACSALLATPVAVRHKEGSTHGFLLLRTLEGKTLAAGDLIQVVHDDQVTTELILHFRDGSLHDETTVYSQRTAFHLISDHLVQKGPSFPHAMEVMIDTAKDEFTVHYTDKGEEKVESQQMEMPEDLANGLMLALVKNIEPEALQTVVSMVAATPKPRVVKLLISPSGKHSFSTGGSPRIATGFVIKVEIGGVAGVIAPLVGKKPSDTHIWVYEGAAPTFLRFEGALFEGGPIWRIELANVVWH